MQSNPLSYIEVKGNRDKYSTDDYYDCFNFTKNYATVSSIGYDIPKTKIIKERSFAVDEKFTVLDQDFMVPPGFKDIVEEIIDSQDILKLEADWDMNGADPISPSLYLDAIRFLLFYSIYIYKDLGVIITAPEINPCRNGSIDFSWRTEGARLLINIRNKSENVTATFFGYHKPEKFPIEGVIDMKKIDKDIASWMRKLK